MRLSTQIDAEIAVVGAGPAGLTAALALGATGANVTVVAPPPEAAPPDQRTTALLLGSLELLRNLGVWANCMGAAESLGGIRIVDDRAGLLRAPEVLFRAGELGLECFGANVPNRDLTAALRAAAERSPRVRWRATTGVRKAVPLGDCVQLELAEGGLLKARLAVAADGRNSIVRTGADIAVRTWRYPQAAIAASFCHTRPHGAVSTELHRRNGPLTTVPLPGNRSSVVWVEAPEEAERIALLSDAAFVAALETHLRGLLGKVSAPSPRAHHPLGGASADVLGQRRIALVGEAAHVFPPIGAQGLNLGFRDAAALADCVAGARAENRDVGDEQTLRAYHRARATDVLTRTASVDLLNRSLLSDFLPVQALRGMGLHLLANVPPLRRLAMQGGLGPPGPLPRLMRPGALP